MGIVAEPAYPMEFGRQVNRCAKVLSYYTHALLAGFTAERASYKCM